MFCLSCTGDLTLVLDPMQENNRYVFASGSSIQIECRAVCRCGGVRAEWSEPSNLPSGLQAIPTAPSGRVVALRTRPGTTAQREHSGTYVCRVYNNDESITQRIEIVVN